MREGAGGPLELQQFDDADQVNAADNCGDDECQGVGAGEIEAYPHDGGGPQQESCGKK